MNIESIYAKSITREVNPAVTADARDEQTVNTQIEEYVFTDKIINCIFEVLGAIRNRNKHHDGIWISGYYGSGKSHFLKYLEYCLSTEHGERALARLAEAVKENDPLTNNQSKSVVSPQDMIDMKDWIGKSNIDTVVFNIGQEADASAKKTSVFVDVLWRQFYKFRGYNDKNIALAQNLEKALDDRGKLQEFRQRMRDEGYTNLVELATLELDKPIEWAKELIPGLSADVIREKIKNNDVTLSVAAFTDELASYLADKDDKYRLLFFIDEVSQYINNDLSLLLQLQSIIELLHSKCKDKIWIVCTAQQDLTEMMGEMHEAETSDNYGKIMGRFEVKVSLTDIKTEYITKKRILDKKPDAALELDKIYSLKKTALENQFSLPTGYERYKDNEDFISYYPFVPYQFKLIMEVFESFRQIDFVEREVKDNQRSVIKVTHSTARDTKDQEVGEYIVPFDQFFNKMFRDSLRNVAQKRYSKAQAVIDTYTDKDFGSRVLKVLFMICNLSESDKKRFPATIDNVMNLLIDSLDVQKGQLTQRIKDVVEYLCVNNIIYPETHEGRLNTYAFYTEEAMEMANIIKNQIVDNSTLADLIKTVLFSYASISNSRIDYQSIRPNCTFRVWTRDYYNGQDAKIMFNLEKDASDTLFGTARAKNELVFHMQSGFDADLALREKLVGYARVNKYTSNNAPDNEEKKKCQNDFKSRADVDWQNVIVPGLRKMFDECEITSGTDSLVINPNLKGKERFKEATQKHFESVYPYASLAAANGVAKSKDELVRHITRPVDPNEYAMEKDYLPDAQALVESNLSSVDSVLDDIVKKYLEAPYGWNEYATMDFVNELVRRGKREYTYNGQQNVPYATIAQYISNSTKITVRPAKMIAQDVINNFVAAWKLVFNDPTMTTTTDSSQLINFCKDKTSKLVSTLSQLISRSTGAPFACHLNELNQLATKWNGLRDPESFFSAFTADKDVAKDLMDKQKNIIPFLDNQKASYDEIIRFCSTNQSDFGTLTGEEQDAAASLAQISTDTEPWGPRFRNYMKLRDQIKSALEAKRDAVRQEIREAYEKVFEDLCNLAQNVGVDYTPQNGVVDIKTAATSINQLINNKLTDAFYQQEASKIMLEKQKKDAAQKPASSPTSGNEDSKKDDSPANTGAEAPSTYKKSSTKPLKLNTRSSNSLKTKEDVDKYLDTLRQQIMEKINNGEEVIIL